MGLNSPLKTRQLPETHSSGRYGQWYLEFLISESRLMLNKRLRRVRGLYLVIIAEVSIF